MTGPIGLGGRLFAAQLVVILLAGATLVVTVLAVAPSLFLNHLAMTGEDSPIVQQHALEAFRSSAGLAFVAAATAAVLAAVMLSWFLSRRVSRPVEELAVAAEAVAAGHYDIRVPDTGFGPELAALSSSFQRMADDLAVTDAARTGLLADLAHEIRTPLATLEVHIDGLEDGIVPASPETFGVLRDQVARLRRLATDIKTTAAAQEHALDLHPRTMQVADVLQAACDAAAPRYHAADITLGCASDAAAITVDPDRIQQVLANLLDNALRHTPTGGCVTVTAHASGGSVVVKVADTGDGIPPEELEAVFQRFHRLDPARASQGGGSGLGLTIARAIVADHGGSLVAESPGRGGGTTLVLRLPASADSDGSA